MTAKIKNRREIAEGTLLINFDVAEQSVKFIPGQYFFITLIDPPHTDKRGNQRHFTIVNSPKEKGLITMATRIREESAFKRSLRDMPLNSRVEIGAILGNFILPKDNSRSLVFIAGGIGITPFISMLRHIKNNNLDYKITLIYANRDQKSTAFLEELKILAKENSKFKLILIISDDTGWKGESRKINGQFIKDYLPDFKTKIYFVSGPPTMVKAISSVLSGLDIDKENIKLENFTGY